MKEVVKKHIHVLVIEDEVAAQQLLKNYIERLPSLFLVGICNNALEGLAVLHQHPVDILFCDIKLPQLNGLDFIQTLRNPPAIVLTTAFSDYALESYELDIQDYLLKPFPFERFVKAVNKCMRHNNNIHLLPQQFPTENNNNVNTLPEKPTPESKEENYALSFIEKGKNVTLRYNNILYAEGYGNYVRLYTPQRMYLYDGSLLTLEKILPAIEFVRIHKSYLISLHFAHTFNEETITVANTVLPVGRNYKMLLADRLRTYSHKLEP